MVDVRGDILQPPDCTTSAAVKANKNQKAMKQDYTGNCFSYSDW